MGLIPLVCHLLSLPARLAQAIPFDLQQTLMAQHF
jgi:hypothetical protein